MDWAVFDAIFPKEKIVFQKQEEQSYVVPHICSIRVLGNDRNKLKQILEDYSIPVGIHYKPNHLLTFYKTDYSLPVTEKLYDEIMTLPLHPELQISDVETICDIINKYLNIYLNN